MTTLPVRVCEPVARYRSLSTGAVVPAWCGAWRCLRCGGNKARLAMCAASFRGHERFVTLTGLGDTWQIRRGRVKRLVHELAARGARTTLVWTVEENPRETGFHAHGLSGGDWASQRLWSRACDAVGLGRVMWIEKAAGDAAGMYATKAALYSTKLVQSGPEVYASWLSNNGGRGVHWSRGAFGPGGFPQAKRDYLAATVGESSDPGPWIREALPH